MGQPMQRILTLMGAIMAILTSAPAVAAIDFTQTGAVLTVTYTEPSTNADGSLLTDLGKTNVYYKINAGANVKGQDTLASKPAGGGPISTTITVPVVAGQEANVTMTATATDLSGNESAASAPVTKRVDRLAPAAPK